MTMMARRADGDVYNVCAITPLRAHIQYPSRASDNGDGRDDLIYDNAGINSVGNRYDRLKIGFPRPGP